MKNIIGVCGGFVFTFILIYIFGTKSSREI